MPGTAPDVAEGELQWGTSVELGHSIFCCPALHLLCRFPVGSRVLCVLALPETEAPHLGVSSGGVEVEGVFAKFAGKHLGIEQPAA